MFYFFVLLFGFIQSCFKGCLKCDIQRGCLICDIKKGYYLKNNICVVQQIQNCKIFSIDGQCLECQDHYRFCNNSYQCIKAQTIKNCLKYNENNQCKSCVKDYYVSNGTCKIVDVFIKNCAVYLDNKLCQQCDFGYLLTYDNKFCTFSGETENCQFWSQIECLQCKQGYIKNINFHQVDLIQQNQNLYLDYFNQDDILMKNFKVCQKILVQNCDVLRTFQTCSKCKKGFYLSIDFKCIQFPLPEIPQCIDYLNATTCNDCLQGFHLYQNQCEEIEIIQNCTLYDTKNKYSICIRCNSDYYLQDNKCALRKQSLNQRILNCLKYDIYSDTCEECISNHFLSKNKLSCKQKLQNCKKEEENYEKGELKCLECNDGFYLQEAFCVIGNLANCLEYKNKNLCKKCENQYYLTSNQNCEKSISINKCLIYDGQQSNIPNTCKQCNQDSFNFKINSYCKQVPLIDHCLYYDQYKKESICIKCNKGYFLANSKSCQVFSNSMCSDGNNINDCNECFANFALIKNQNNSQCSQPYHHIIDNCYKHNVDKINSIKIQDVQCQSCQQNYLLYDMQYKYICYEKQHLVNEQIPINLQIQKCQKYQPIIGCIQCQEGYYLQQNNGVQQCMQQCSNDYSLLLISLEKQDNKYQVDLNDQCILKNNNCQVYAPQTYGSYQLKNLDDNFINLDDMYICIQCKVDRVKVVKKQIQRYTNVRYDQTRRDLYVKHYLDFYPEVRCYYPIMLNQKPIEQQDQNCQYYHELDTPQNLGCSLCKYGYFGTIKMNNQFTYVDDCQQDLQCKDNIILKGLHQYYQNYVSCFQCKEKGKIIVIKIEAQIQDEILIINQLSQIDINNPSYSCKWESEIYKTNQKLLPNFCQYVFIDTNQQIENFTDNQKINFDFNENEPPKLSIFCGGCKPGFKPTFINDINQHIITNCQKIDNCDMNQKQDIINKCSKCNDGYVFKYEDNSNFQIKQDECIESLDINCFAAIQINQGQSQCKVCKKGYFLNLDFICEQITTNLCINSDNSVFQQSYQIGLVLDYYYYAFSQGNGCNQCSGDNLAVKIMQQKNICIESQYIKDNKKFKEIFQNQSNFYIDNCKIYSKSNNQYICDQCIQDYILTQTKQKCIQQIDNCLLANDNQIDCLLCQQNYALVKNKCIKGSITNCKDYYNDENKNKILCKNCQEGYYKDIAEEYCLMGLVHNCKIYDHNSQKKCQQCKEGYMLQKKIIDICYPIDLILNCKNAKYNNGIECTQCIDENFIFVNQQFENYDLLQQTICMDYNKIENCKLYDINSNYNYNTFQCIECLQNFYLKDYKCIIRQNIDPSCSIYNLHNDFCDKCVTGNYLNEQKTKCELYPNGFEGCIEYENQSKCIKCTADYYLNGNNCFKLKQEDMILNCIKYELNQNIVCLQCQQDYYLKKQECIKAIAKNCFTYKNENTCKTCIDNFVLKKNDNGIINCENIIIQNCKQINHQNPYECLVCNQDYFLNEQKICTKITKIIKGCISYKSNNECQICNSDYILDKQLNICINKNSINQNLDVNCLQNIYQFEPVCQSCYSGYVLINNNCVQCKNNNSCAYCSSLNIELCLMCKSGYYQDKDLNCIEIIEQIQDKISIIFTKLFLILLINL